jgi:hypothetical protein
MQLPSTNIISAHISSCISDNNSRKRVYYLSLQEKNEKRSEVDDPENSDQNIHLTSCRKIALCSITECVGSLTGRGNQIQ